MFGPTAQPNECYMKRSASALPSIGQKLLTLCHVRALKLGRREPAVRLQ